MPTVSLNELTCDQSLQSVCGSGLGKYEKLVVTRSGGGTGNLCKYTEVPWNFRVSKYGFIARVHNSSAWAL